MVKFSRKFRFTTETPPRSLAGASTYFTAFLVSHDPSRKNFLGKLIGLAALAGLAPRLLAKIPSATLSPASPAVTVRAEPRAVARRGRAA